MVETVDAIVVGLGVGGEEVAGRLAQAGLSVVGIESTLVGGECPYWGCVPSKMMIRAANLLAETRRVDGLAGHATATADWSAVAQRIRNEATDTWDDRVAVERFTGKGGTFVRGRARVTGPGQVTVGERSFEASRALVIATGQVPVIPSIEGLAGTPFWTNREAIEVELLPESLLIVGGGAIGLELGQVFARFGVAVTIVEPAPRLLAREEPESSALAQSVLEHDGITVHTGLAVRAIGHDGSRFSLTLGDNSTLHAEKLLVATGRRCDFGGLGLDTIGLDPAARSIQTDEHLRTPAARTWAVGDITGHGAFTHMAMYQAGIAIRDILGEPGPGADYHAVPRVTFTDPEIGAVGLTEQQARDAGIRVSVATSDAAASTRGWIHRAEGFVKLVADADRGVLIGATASGPVGGEVLFGLALAVQAAVPLPTLREMIFAYPTFHRGVEPALAALSR